MRARTDEHGRLELTVSDQGPGLAPELAQRIFERFERGHRADQARGFGLGLWVARRIARLHGGDIQAAPSVQLHAHLAHQPPPVRQVLTQRVGELRRRIRKSIQPGVRPTQRRYSAMGLLPSSGNCSW